ncbi:MAG TPA: DUF2157 domain-containing protein [Candidatus Dormibacteraeota bacterium]|nr:DUF2157 domain-containing protein [Candidatus Dormibacteraeota bacterium]
MIPAVVDPILAERLAAWREAGIVDADTVARISAFEDARPAAPRWAGGRVTVSEVVAYIGAVVLLVGIGFLYGTEYANLGSAGRLIILALVVIPGLAAGTLVERVGGSAAARRARAAGWGVASVAASAFLAQLFVDNNILTRPPQYDYEGASPDTSGSLMVAAALGAVMAAILLWRAGAALLALVTAAGLYTAAGFLDAYLRFSSPGWTAELTWIVPAAAILGLSETITRGIGRTWARELLRFMVILPLLIVTLVISNASQATGIELFAGFVAVAGFGLALTRSSAGYAIAAGIGLFIFVNEVGFRHFSNTLGFPVVLIISGIALFAIAAGLVGILRRLQKRP